MPWSDGKHDNIISWIWIDFFECPITDIECETRHPRSRDFRKNKINVFDIWQLKTPCDVFSMHALIDADRSQDFACIVRGTTDIRAKAGPVWALGRRAHRSRSLAHQLRLPVWTPTCTGLGNSTGLVWRPNSDVIGRQLRSNTSEFYASSKIIFCNTNLVLYDLTLFFQY